MQRYLLIAIGGAAGAMLRYWVGGAVGDRMGARFPWGTLVINVTACFIIGVVLEYLNHHAGVNPAWRFLIPIGFIGAYSTFSTFEFEIWMNVTTGAFWIAVAYVVVSLVAGFVAVAPDYRGCGKSEGKRELAKGEVNDVLNAVRYAQGLRCVDAK
ncbi:MAG: fluoride efflux transporter CrcB, partial [Acidobacteriota bacterium]